jgi:hypothetical protein
VETPREFLAGLRAPLSPWSSPPTAPSTPRPPPRARR